MKPLRCLLLLLTGLLPLWGMAAQAPASVGTVTLTIGVSQVVRGSQTLPLAKGSEIDVGDRIETTDSGHVHIRFVDGARVSVRPDSVLRVEDYQYDPRHPDQSAVKFDLEKGVARAISGDAAHQARDRFRLNTPLVAIGVRGTDFTTQAGPVSTVVVVNQGAIVLAPLGGACQAAGLGPCLGSRARELSASMGGTALVYRANMPEPSFQPINALKGTDKITPIMEQERQGAAQTQGVVADSKSPSTIVGFLPNAPSLTWGRWAGNALPGDDLTVPFLTALQGRQVTVGDGYYFLFRNETGPNLLGSAAAGTASFTLQGGAANYRSSGNVYSAATIQGGSLGIDFVHDTFATSLNVTSGATGSQNVSATGTLNPVNGIFIGNGADSKVAGAVSLNSLQAGYLFSKSFANGSALTGATL
ncbi:MAG: FecR domain-containing protein, partial [Betaproteobacteria bacterium]|nr:FecR domain-containing protein [Betaproteobacteria bacterium]